MAEIVLYGASGYTGRLIAAELRRRGVVPLLAGRRRAPLEQLAADWGPAAPVGVAAADDQAALQQLLRGARVLINAAGPFTELGPPVIRAALQAGLHYLDTTGEQFFMLRCRSELHKQAANSGLALINAAAFEYALSTLASALLLQQLGPVEQLDVAYLIGDTRSSRGTKKSMLRIAARPGLAFEQQRFVLRWPLSVLRQVHSSQGHSSWAGWVPGGEILIVPRLGQVGSVRSFFASSEPLLRAARLLAPLLPLLALAPARRLLDRLLQQTSVGPAGAGPGRDSEIILETRSPAARWTLHLRDPYGISAVIVVEGALRLLAAPPRQVGVVSCAEAFDPASFLDRLARHGCSLSRQAGA